MTDDLRADLDQLLIEARRRPILYRFGRRQRAQDIAGAHGAQPQIAERVERD
jgi:hypothetical protein